jgi:putative transposase
MSKEIPGIASFVGIRLSSLMRRADGPSTLSASGGTDQLFGCTLPSLRRSGVSSRSNFVFEDDHWRRRRVSDDVIGDLSPDNSSKMGRVRHLEGNGHEAEPFHGRADHRDFAGAGGRREDVCRKHGISSTTFYKWKAKYGGLEVSDAKRLKSLEDENAKVKKLLAEVMLDKRC